VRARRQTRREAVAVQSAFTLWGFLDCSERAEALAMLADQNDHTQNSFRTSKRTCPHCRSTEIYGRRPRWVAQIGDNGTCRAVRAWGRYDMHSSSGQVGSIGMAYDRW